MPEAISEKVQWCVPLQHSHAPPYTCGMRCAVVMAVGLLAELQWHMLASELHALTTSACGALRALTACGLATQDEVYQRRTRAPPAVARVRAPRVLAQANRGT
eukprot:NODE_5922_length_1721_cov_6.487453.p2 GENE.NODE_5922_length_1721_cov_6.487453~~NODE_5922_length_1721_cov_6.487453.p2  ORF type:complete len:103 (-),score=7.59 NODE_5922_length_1721_cov_6.487453:446-754(-)